MIPEEILPFIERIDALVAKLEGRDCDDIVEALLFYKRQIKNDFTAKATCRAVERMCHPRAWGDRFVSGMNHGQWLILLGELKAAGAQALKRIEKRQAGA